MVILVKIEKGEPTFYESGRTMQELKSKLDIDGVDVEGLINDIKNADFSGVDTKFEIRSGVWVLFS